jgi:hypothetical protein
MVTGAASGIGRAVAGRLAAAGAAVTVLDLDGEAAGRAAEEIGGADLSDYGELDSLEFETDVLVNNAGVQHVDAIEEFPPEKFSMMMRLMQEAPFRLAQKALPGMYEKGWGRIINISSVHGLRASPYKAAYISAKHGVEGLSKVIALEGGLPGRDEQLHLPGLREDAAGGGPDSGPGAHARHLREGGDREGNADRPRDQTPNPTGGGRRVRRLPLLRAGLVRNRRLPNDGRRRDRPMVGKRGERR